jgi:quinoprotein glucose dehydrogenase
VILYADAETESIRVTIEETTRRRERQEAYNTEHGITPKTIQKRISSLQSSIWEADYVTVPKKGETGYDTWLEGSAEYTGATNVWGGMSYDPELDYVYMATSTPNNDYYGGQRLGDNLFAETLVCVEARTGRRVWHFQAVHHGLWDYDFPTPPILGDITVGGRRIKAVIQVSKQAFTYVFDRKSGKPVWPIEERRVPQSTVPRERTAPTQPFPTRPPAFDLQGTTEDSLMNFTPELRKRALAVLQTYEYGPLFTPPSVKGTITLPGMFGGANWGGAAFDPETGMLYVPSRTDASVHRVTPSDPAKSNTLFRSGGTGPGIDKATVDGLPIFKPPYSRVTAIDLNRGTLAWTTPIGNGPRNHPLLRDLKLGPLGDSLYGASALVTKSLLFVTAMHRQYNGDPIPPSWAQWGDADRAQRVLHVFDKRTGAVLRVVNMEGLTGAAPMTYMHDGRQYVVVATGAGESSELVAFALRP